MLKIKNYYFLLGLLFFFANCGNDNQRPTVEVQLITTPSDDWESASINIQSLVFNFDASEPALLGGQRTRSWDGVAFQQDLTIQQDAAISSFSHMEMTTFGLQFDWEITLFDGNTSATQEVTITNNNLEYLPFPEEVVLENGKTYQLVINLDSEVAFEEQNNEVLLNWTGVNVSLLEN